MNMGCFKKLAVENVHELIVLNNILKHMPHINHGAVPVNLVNL